MEGKEVNEEVYRASFQELTAPSYILDESYKIIDLNKAMCDLFNNSSDKLIGSLVSDLFHDQSEYNKVIERLRVESEIVLDDIKFQNVSGVIISTSLRMKKLNIQGTSRFYGTLQQSNLAYGCGDEALFEEILITVRQIARSIGHEIRNPLTNLTLAIDQLAEEVGEDEDNQLYFNIINRNASRIERLISDMLESTKVVDLYSDLMDVNELIETWTQSMPVQESNETTELRIGLKGDLPKVRIDPEKLYIAFRNILDNAYQAVERIENGMIEIKTLTDKHHVIIVIEDNGVGIAPENISKIFSPFFTGDEKWGSGLGLTQAKNIITAHHGSIQVESQLGEGSTFLILLKV